MTAEGDGIGGAVSGHVGQHDLLGVGAVLHHERDRSIDTAQGHLQDRRGERIVIAAYGSADRIGAVELVAVFRGLVRTNIGRGGCRLRAYLTFLVNSDTGDGLTSARARTTAL